MKSTAINSIYVVFVTTEYTDITVASINKSFFREDDAKKYVERMQKKSDECIQDFLVETWDYKEIDIE